MKNISISELEAVLGKDGGPLLINVLPVDRFRRKHIPGSNNVPLGRGDFAANLERVAGGKSARLVVYSESQDCSDWKRAARKLEDVGFTNVSVFEGGVKEWEEAGRALEGSTVAAREG